MKFIEPSFQIECGLPYHEMLSVLESAARTCYKSEDKIGEGTAEKLLGSCLKVGHESVIEHASVSVRIITQRGTMDEHRTHRLASFSVESTRYCNYSTEKFGGGITVVLPHWYGDGSSAKAKTWRKAMQCANTAYYDMIMNGATAQEARGVLPLDLKCEYVSTANIREWRHIFSLRCAKAAHPEMRRIMIPMLTEFSKRWPVFFGDILKNIGGE